MTAFSSIIFGLATYTGWAVFFSNSLFHRVWSCALLLCPVLAAYADDETFAGGRAIAILALTLDILLCLCLSPLQLVIQFILPQKPSRASSERITIIHDSTKTLPDSSILEPDTIPLVDVVAVHGLGSKSDLAWIERGSQLNWLKDFLPELGLRVCIILYNHNSVWAEKALSLTIEDFGEDLLRTVDGIRRNNGSKRPVIFIGHSFGGIIIQQALVMAAESKLAPEYCEITKCAKGFIFIGAPHQGSAFAHFGKLQSLLGYWNGSSTELLEILTPGNVHLKRLHNSFLSSYGDNQIVNFYEAYPETWANIPITRVVTKESATMSGRGPNVQNISLQKKHRESNKYSSQHDGDYIAIQQQVERMYSILSTNMIDVESQHLGLPRPSRSRANSGSGQRIQSKPGDDEDDQFALFRTRAGYFRIQNCNTLKVLGTLHASSTRGAQVTQYTDCGAADQLWTLGQDVNGYAKLRNKHSGLLLAVEGLSISDGANLVQWDDDGTSDHLWTFIGNGQGEFQILNQNSNKFVAVSNLSTADHARAVQYADHGPANQLWRFLRVSPFYRIKNKRSGKLLAVTFMSFDDGIDIVQHWDNGTTDHNWCFYETGTGYFQIKNAHSGKVLAVSGMSAENGAIVQQTRNTNTPDQFWKLVDNHDGTDYVRIMNQHSGKVIAVSDMSIEDGARICQYTDNGTDDHLWCFLPA